MAGVCGIASYSASQRVREIGIRMALGAGKRSVLQLVAGQALPQALAGIALGLTGGLLFGATATDPASFSTAGALLLAVTSPAAWAPARRAAGVDPLVTLGHV